MQAHSLRNQRQERNAKMSVPNQEQREYWNGQAGAQWVQDQAYLDALLEPLSQQALQAASAEPGDNVLDVGCGCGTTSQLLAHRAASVTGIDLSAPMINHARHRSRKLSNLDFVVTDASRWRGNAPFDLAFSRFGVMFFEDPVAAFSNLRLNLKDSGRLCFVCWRRPQDNPWMSIPAAAAASFLPEAQPDTGPDPFAFADTAFVTSILTEAGFQHPEFKLVEADLNLGADIEAAIGFLSRIGPLARVIKELDEPQQMAALDAVRQALGPSVTARGVLLNGSTWVVQAAAGEHHHHSDDNR